MNQLFAIGGKSKTGADYWFYTIQTASWLLAWVWVVDRRIFINYKIFHYRLKLIRLGKEKICIYTLNYGKLVRRGLNLSKEERETWFNKLLGSLQEQIQSGVEPLGFAQNDRDTPLSAGYDFVGAWKMPSKEVAQQFEKFVEGAGWHNYFEQVNVRGQMIEINVFSSSHIDMESR